MTRIACLATATMMASPAQGDEGRFVDRQQKCIVERNAETGANASLMIASLHRDMSRIARLQPGWDRQGAPSISPASLESAWRFSRRIPHHLLPTPRVVPTPDGNVQFEWHARNISLEIEFGQDGSIQFLKWDPDAGVEEDGIIEDAPGNAERVMRWFAEKLIDVQR